MGYTGIFEQDRRTIEDLELSISERQKYALDKSIDHNGVIFEIGDVPSATLEIFLTLVNNHRGARMRVGNRALSKSEIEAELDKRKKYGESKKGFCSEHEDCLEFPYTLGRPCYLVRHPEARTDDEIVIKKEAS